jgi:hypothetical protein
MIKQVTENGNIPKKKRRVLFTFRHTTQQNPSTDKKTNISTGIQEHFSKL